MYTFNNSIIESPRNKIKPHEWGPGLLLSQSALALYVGRNGFHFKYHKQKRDDGVRNQNSGDAD